MRKAKGYFVGSVLALALGLLIYVFFRNGDTLLYRWFPFPLQNKGVPLFFAPDFFRYNLPDGLWLLSGLLFLRALWNERPKTFLVYQLAFLLVAFALELAQAWEGVAGTFDPLDVLTMGSTALLERMAHKSKRIRRA